MLKEEAAKVLESSNRKSRVIPDPNLYFVLDFATNLRSTTVRRFLAEAELIPVTAIDDTSAKLRISKGRYESFLKALQKYHAYIKGIRESTLEDKVEKRLLIELASESDRSVRVNIEIPKTIDQEYVSKVLEELDNFVESRHLPALERTYSSDYFVLVTGVFPGKVVQEIANNLDAIQRISLASLVSFQSAIQTVGRSMRMESLSVAPQLAVPNLSAMPSVCILDTGINRSHSYIQPYVIDTYDFTTGAATPCSDNVGHGSMVAGCAIYEGDVNASQPVSGVIVGKISNSMEISGNVIEFVRSAIERFRDQTNVVNLSFATDYPDPALSKALDDIAYRKKILLVACTGNIQPQEMMKELNDGAPYPGYLKKYHVFFPGDCYNVLTVGSFAAKASNPALDGYPSPFTRSSPFLSRMKPEVLASGGNVNFVSTNGRFTDVNCTGCGITCADSNDNLLREAMGTSFSSPIVSSIAAATVSKWGDRPPCFYKAMIVSSCQPSMDRGGNTFDPAIQGFGNPSRTSALYSYYWRINLFWNAEFDIRKPDEYHRYRFLVPDNADQVRVTICQDVEPLLDSELPYEIDLKLHKTGTKFSTPSSPSKETPMGTSNLKQYDFQIQRAGRGIWSLDLFPKWKPALFLGRFGEVVMRYAIVITVMSTKRLDVYNRVVSSLRQSQSRS